MGVIVPFEIFQLRRGNYSKASHSICSGCFANVRFTKVLRRKPVVSPTGRFAYTEVDSPTQVKSSRLHTKK